jgi:predicted ABC-type ATPase
MKRYVLLAGVNGAGKSTLFSLIPSLSEISKINLDDTVRTIGDWRDAKAVIRAGKLVVCRINDYFDNGISFSQETTLCRDSREFKKDIATV